MRHTLTTLEEVLIGFALALVVGIAAAMAIAYSRIVERAAYPFVIASQTVPIIAIAPLLLVWIGYGIWPKIIVVVLISFFPIVVNMVDGLKSVDPDIAQHDALPGCWPAADIHQGAGAVLAALPLLRRPGGDSPERHRRRDRGVGGVQRRSGLPDDPLSLPSFLPSVSLPPSSFCQSWALPSSRWWCWWSAWRCPGTSGRGEPRPWRSCEYEQS